MVTCPHPHPEHHIAIPDGHHTTPHCPAPHSSIPASTVRVKGFTRRPPRRPPSPWHTAPRAARSCGAQSGTKCVGTQVRARRGEGVGPRGGCGRARDGTATGLLTHPGIHPGTHSIAPHLSNAGHQGQRVLAPPHFGLDVGHTTRHTGPGALVVQQAPVQAPSFTANHKGRRQLALLRKRYGSAW
jgi:hypothetical protein